MRARSRYLWMTLFALASCGRCEACAGHADVAHEENGLRVVIDARGFRELGMGAIGAPHAFGILYPTMAGGYEVLMRVDDRPAVRVSQGGDGSTPNDEQMRVVAEAVRVSVAPDAAHVAVTADERVHVFHLLAVGTPFDAPGSLLDEGAELDWSSVESPDAIVDRFFADPSLTHDEYELLWDAVEAQPPDAARDVAMLALWPSSTRANAVVALRLSGDEPLAEPLRVALSTRARDIVENTEPDAAAYARGRHTGTYGVDWHVHAENALLALGGGDSDWLDARRVEAWADVRGGEEGRRMAARYLDGRLRRRADPLGATVLGSQVDDALLTGARAVLEHRRPSTHPEPTYERRTGVMVVGAANHEDLTAVSRDLGLALYALRERGGDAGRAEHLAYLRREWPTQDYDALDREIEWLTETRRDDEDVRAMVRAGAERAFADQADVQHVAHVLFLWDDRELDELAFRALIAHFDQMHCYAIQDHLDRVTPPIRDALIAKADAFVSELAAGPRQGTRFDAACAIAIAFTLQQDDADCDRLSGLGEAHERTGAMGARLEMPARCVPAN